jgi:hypothetical protein
MHACLCRTQADRCLHVFFLVLSFSLEDGGITSPTLHGDTSIGTVNTLHSQRPEDPRSQVCVTVSRGALHTASKHDSLAIVMKVSVLLTEQVGSAVTLSVRILQLPCSAVSGIPVTLTGHCFPQCLQTYTGRINWLGDRRFFSRPFQFIIRHSCNTTLSERRKIKPRNKFFYSSGIADDYPIRFLLPLPEVTEGNFHSTRRNCDVKVMLQVLRCPVSAVRCSVAVGLPTVLRHKLVSIRNIRPTL